MRHGGEVGATSAVGQARVGAGAFGAGAFRGGEDGHDIENGIAGYLDYLSQLCGHLGVPDPVEEYFSPVIGRWSAMHEEAERWRSAAHVAEEMSQVVTNPLGSLDAAWHGADADSFIEYMRRVGLAGTGLSDAMNAMADALDTTADGIREIVRALADVLVDTAESTSLAMSMPVLGEHRVRQQLAEIRQPAAELFESVRDVMEAFVRLCDRADGSTVFDAITMAHTFPEENWSPRVDLPTPVIDVPEGPRVTDSSSASGPATGGGGAGGGVGGGVGGAPADRPLAASGAYTMATERLAAPSAPAAAPAGAAQGSGLHQGGGFGGMPMMPMGAGMGAAGGGDQERRTASRVTGRPEDILGTPIKTAPEVIGEPEPDPKAT